MAHLQVGMFFGPGPCRSICDPEWLTVTEAATPEVGDYVRMADGGTGRIYEIDMVNAFPYGIHCDRQYVPCMRSAFTIICKARS